MYMQFSVLVQVEALHIWRICADHDEAFMHLDDAYAAICRLFSIPTSSALSHHANGNGDSDIDSSHVGASHNSKAVASRAALLQKLQVQASCQAFLLLGSLVRHATRYFAQTFHYDSTCVFSQLQLTFVSIDWVVIWELWKFQVPEAYLPLQVQFLHLMYVWCG